jgi:hypothetical protein
MTISQLILDRYNRRHTREGGYPGTKTTFYEFINIEDLWMSLRSINLFSVRVYFPTACGDKFSFTFDGLGFPSPHLDIPDLGQGVKGYKMLISFFDTCF